MGLHNMANAFPSMGHDTLDTAMDTHAKHGEAGLLKFRYKHTLMEIPCRDGTTAYVHPHCGGLQGDSVMAPMFREAYDEKLEHWNDSREQTWAGKMLMANVPGTDDKLQVARTAYADDLAETNIVANTRQVETVSRASNSKLDGCLAEAQMGQNADKEELLINLQGPGSARAMQQIWAGNIEVRGEVKQTAKYLGNIRSSDGRTRANIDKRISAAEEGYHMLKGFWGKRGVPHTVTVQIFHAQVVGAGLSGLEAETPTEADTELLDKQGPRQTC